MTQVPDTAQAEAAELFGKALSDLSSPTRDLRLVLRTCSHACLLAGWSQQRRWFQQELEGYAPDDELPWYRTIAGVLEWKTDDIEAAVASVVAARPFPASKPITQGFRHGIAWIQSWATTGVVERTGKRDTYVAFNRRSHVIHQQRSFPAVNFASVLAHVEEITYKFASESYTTLRYGNALQDVWHSHRYVVEQRLPELGISQHLQTIEHGLRSTNPQDWRAVLWACRDLLHDLAAALWQDPRPTYVHLPGKGKGGHLSVTPSEYINRLGAYIHQKSVTGTMGEYLRAEMERIYSAISTLNSLASTAHGGATVADARSVAIGTYVLLGELALRTGLVPIKQYSDQPPGSE